MIDRIPKVCDCGEHAWIPLTRGFVTMVDPADIALLATRTWNALVTISRVIYARAHPGIFLHRVLLDYPESTDHIDRNGLNNRRKNLRACTLAQNQANKKTRGREFRGVYRHSKTTWIARVRTKEKIYNLGTFKDKAEAAKAYDKAAVKYFGEFASLNFPTQP